MFQDHGSSASRFLSSLPPTPTRGRALPSTPAARREQSERPRRRSSTPTMSLFGRPQPKNVPLSSTGDAVSTVEPRFHTVSTATEGGVCELRIEDVGAYGLFCGVLVGTSQCPEPRRGGLDRSALSSSSVRSTHASETHVPHAGVVRRRWVQLARQSVHEAPRLELFATRPSASASSTAEDGQPHGSAFVSVPFDTLQGVVHHNATTATLAFRATERGCDVVRKYTLCFDCPSHAFRWRLVLEAWWAGDSSSQCDPRRHQVVALRTRDLLAMADQSGSLAAGAAIGSACTWDALERSLTREVVLRRLGTLWRDVQLRLLAAAI